MRLAVLASVFAIASTLAHAEATSTSRPMSFEDCLETIRQVSTDLGVAPVNIMETTDVRMVRFITADGSVIITCSRPDKKMVITRSTN